MTFTAGGEGCFSGEFRAIGENNLDGAGIERMASRRMSASKLNKGAICE